MHIPLTSSDPPQPAEAPNDNTAPWRKRLEIGAFAVAVGLLMVNIYQAFSTQTAAEAAKSAADTAAAQLELSERPWVTVNMTITQPKKQRYTGFAAPSLTFNADGTASFNAFVILKNIGHSVAKAIYVRPQMYPPVFERILTEPMVKQKEWCDKVRGETPDEKQLPSLFPDEVDIESFSFGMSRSDIEVAKTSGVFGRFHALTPVILGCINYKSSLSNVVHQTPVLYRLNPVPVDIGTIPASRLELTKLFAGMGAN